MTREPDRFDKQALHITERCRYHDPDTPAGFACMECIAAALRAVESSALERAAQKLIEMSDSYVERSQNEYERRGRSTTAMELSAMAKALDEGVTAIRALIPPAAAPESQRDIPCRGCGHPLWWHQWDSKEHAFCCAPLDDLQRDYCQCKNYEKPAAASAADYDPITAPIPVGDMNGPHGPAPAAEPGKAQGAEAPDPESRQSLIRKWMDERNAVIAAEALIRECEETMKVRQHDGMSPGTIRELLAKLAARVAPPEGEGK